MNEKTKDRDIGDKLIDAGEAMRKGGNGVMAVVLCILFLIVIGIPLLLSAFH